jgi:hypothetical protein
LLTLAFGVALAESDRVVHGTVHARERVAEHEPLGPLGMGRGEQHRDRATVIRKILAFLQVLALQTMPALRADVASGH